ncbi:MAG TPA: hypothetical protein VJ875_18700 [Pyrinomonadaceae bacterium]|nr:hypothetical protein [Pyrinomonadaceae bacterium]
MRKALDARDAGKKFDWSDTWVADMFMSGQAAELRKLEMERRLGITPEVKRYNEIKAGVIVSSVGIGLAIFLFIFMQGLVGNVGPEAAQIITRLWIAGIIPFMVGLALIVNGLVVSKKIVEAQQREQKREKLLEEQAAPPGLRPADTSQFIPTGMSVTDQTTRHLQHSEREK